MTRQAAYWPSAAGVTTNGRPCAFSAAPGEIVVAEIEDVGCARIVTGIAWAGVMSLTLAAVTST